MEFSDDFAELAMKNANPANWTWLNQTGPGTPQWIMAEPKWQAFNAIWHGSHSAIQLEGILSIEPLVNPSIGAELPSIFVRKCYATAFEKVWKRAFLSRGRRGSIITGQPGIGKTLLDFYILVLLLQWKQIVLFSLNGRQLYLFYHNTVFYAAAPAVGALQPESQLPQPTIFGVFMWSLFDIEEASEPPSFLVHLPCSPIQPASPGPARYKMWRKQRSAALIALPLWTRDELVLGLPCHEEYALLVEVLRSRDPARVKSSFSDISERLAGRPMDKSSWEDDLDYLLDEAIYYFGYAARDVYNGLFDFPETHRAHWVASRVSYDALKGAVYALALGEISSNTSHEVLAMSPISDSVAVWKITFKSEWMGKAVLNALNKGESAEIARCMRYFQDIPGAQQVVGRFLEPLY